MPPITPARRKPLFYTFWMPPLFVVNAHLIGLVPYVLPAFGFRRPSWRGPIDFIPDTLEGIHGFLDSWYHVGWGYAIVPVALAAGIAVGLLMDRNQPAPDDPDAL